MNIKSPSDTYTCPGLGAYGLLPPHPCPKIGPRARPVGLGVDGPVPPPIGPGVGLAARRARDCVT